MKTAPLFLALSLFASSSCIPGSTLSPGPLSPAHSFMDCASSCQSCHADGGALRDSLCGQAACHASTLRQQLKSEGIHGTMEGASQECRSCHAEHGDPARLTHGTVSPTPIPTMPPVEGRLMSVTMSRSQREVLMLGVVLFPLAIAVVIGASVLRPADATTTVATSRAETLRALAAARDPGRLSPIPVESTTGELSEPSTGHVGRLSGE